MKRFFVLLCALIFVVSCGGNGKKKDENSETNDSADSVADVEVNDEDAADSGSSGDDSDTSNPGNDEDNTDSVGPDDDSDTADDSEPEPANPCENLENSTGEYIGEGKGYSCGCIENYLWSDKKEKCLPKNDCIFLTEYPCIDSETGLLWSDKSDKIEVSQAADFCEQKGADWKAPTISMLRTLVDKCENTMTGGACGIYDSNNATLENCSCEKLTEGGYSKLEDTEILVSKSKASQDYFWSLDFSSAEIKIVLDSETVRMRCAKCADEGYVWNAESALCIQKVPESQNSTEGAECSYNDFVDSCTYDESQNCRVACDAETGKVTVDCYSYYPCVVTLEKRTDGKRHNVAEFFNPDYGNCTHSGSAGSSCLENDNSDKYGDVLLAGECIRTGKGILFKNILSACDAGCNKCETSYMYCGEYAPSLRFPLYNISYNSSYEGRSNEVIVCVASQETACSELPENAVWTGDSTYSGKRYIKENGSFTELDMAHFYDVNQRDVCEFKCSEDSGWDPAQEKCVSGKSCGRLDKVAGAGNSTVCKDPATNLMWSPKMDEMADHSTASAYCENLDFGGYKDWRVPTVSELRTLIINKKELETGGKCPLTDECLDKETCYLYGDYYCGNNWRDSYWRPRSKLEEDSYSYESIFSSGYGVRLWSSSKSDEDEYYYLEFHMDRVGFGYSKEYWISATVRCVR